MNKHLKNSGIALAILLTSIQPSPSARADTSALLFTGEVAAGFVGSVGFGLGGFGASYIFGGMYWLFMGQPDVGWTHNAAVTAAVFLPIGATMGVSLVGGGRNSFTFALAGAVLGEVAAVAYLNSQHVTFDHYFDGGNFLILTLVPSFFSAATYTLFAHKGLLRSEAEPAGLIHYSATQHHWGVGDPELGISPSTTASPGLAVASRSLVRITF